MRWLSAMIRPLASKMRPRSGGMNTSRSLRGRRRFAWYDAALDALQEPQARAERADQQHRHHGQHAEAGGALVDRHGDILVRARRGVGAPSATGRWWVTDGFGLIRELLSMSSLHAHHHRPTGMSNGLSSTDAAVTMGTMTSKRSVIQPSWPVRNFATGIAVSPTAAPTRRRSQPATTAGRG